MLKHVVITALAVALTACGSVGVHQTKVYRLYQGPELAQQQVALIDVPIELNVIAMDGADVGGIVPNLIGGAKQLQVKPGFHQIVFKYDQLFELTSDEHQVVKTDAYSVATEFKAGQHYQFQFSRPNNAIEAEQWAEQPDFKLVANGIDPVMATPYQTASALQGNFLANLSIGEQAQTPVSDSAATSNVDVSESLNLMQFWWKKATPAEKQLFLQWLKTQ